MEPKLSVGILFSKEISFVLSDRYEHKGAHSVKYQNGKVLWNGKEYSELRFISESAQDPFTLKDVMIGIDFHWERKEDQVFQGDLRIIVENEQLTAVNDINVEDYLISVISSEMSATASLDLLKAHAVISRSWLLAQIEKNKEILENKESYSSSIQTEDEIIRWYDREDHNKFDVCADDHCQRYQGITRASQSIDMVGKAVKETRGQVLTYEDKICDARFYKCCGGALEEFQNCWENIKFPYLTKLRDSANPKDLPDLTIEANSLEWIRTRPEAYCDTQDGKILAQVLNNYDQETEDFYRWKISYTQKELSELVKKRSSIDFGTIEELIPVERGTSARLIKLKVVGSKKTMTIGKELEIRRILSESHLYSSAFYVEKEEDKFTLTGAGWGHGVGLCQIGAAVMGEKGYSYNKILLHYYVGANIKAIY